MNKINNIYIYIYIYMCVCVCVFLFDSVCDCVCACVYVCVRNGHISLNALYVEPPRVSRLFFVQAFTIVTDS